MSTMGLEQTIAIMEPGIERLDVGQFHRMIASGILPEGAPIELIDGILVRKDNRDAGGSPMAHGPKHASCLQRLRDLEDRVRPHGFHLRQQLPLTVSTHREPEPDTAIVRGQVRDYQERHPSAQDCLLCIEAADGSLDYDRTVKGPVYAAAQIPVYWIVNLAQRQVEVYREPNAAEGRYTRRRDYGPGEELELELGPGITVRIQAAELLP
jgi:Uma2 family endonuclease